MLNVRDKLLAEIGPQFRPQMKLIEKELDILASTEGLGGQNNLDAFYSIYQAYQGSPPGAKNKINSWTAYAIGMTTQKPDGEFMPVRRVYARAGYPDVDIDFDPDYQDQVQQYLIDTYGRDNVANIGTYQKFDIRDTVRRLSKALDCAYAFHKGKDACRSENKELADEITAALPKPRSGALWGKVDGKDKKLKSVREAAALIDDFGRYIDKYPEILEHADNVGGMIRGFGCITGDTPILTQEGWVRIDSLGEDNKVGYVKEDGLIDFTDEFRLLDQGRKKTYKMTLDNGDSIRITDDHVVFTDHGCVLFEEIRKNPEKHKILCINKYIVEQSILSIEEDNVEQVYDISHLSSRPFLFEEPNFVAHNMILHNCHAAGVVISSEPLSGLAPLRTSKKGLATVFPYEELELIGLIKFDILAIATLTVLRRTLELIKQNYDIDIDLQSIPLDDEKTLSLYRSGHLAGVFQCEQYGMQRTLKDISPTSFDDIMATIALYRPGPMDAIPDYVARKKGEKPIDYFHPSLEKHIKPILEKTYGIPVYQESIMMIVQELAGFSPTKGYVMIKAVGKKKPELMKQYKDMFVSGCLEKNVPKDVAEQYWDKYIVPFSGYGFNLAHSACYGFLSYQTAYLKANYPDEYYVSLLNTLALRAGWDKYDTIEKDLKKRKDIDVLKIDINESQAEWKIVRKRDKKLNILRSELRPGLVVKGVGLNAAQNIVDNQPYKDLRNLAAKTDFDVVTSERVAGLVEAGVFRERGFDKDDIVEQFVKARNDIKRSRARGIDNDADLFE